jgi:hypothetical protein
VKSLLENIHFFCEEHDISSFNMSDEYVNGQRPSQKTNITNLRHYRTYCINFVIGWRLQEFGDRFNEVNSALIINMASSDAK